MKNLRYLVVAIFMLVAGDALAWKAEVNKAVLMFAEENLSNKAKREVNALLGASLSSVEFVKTGRSVTRLNENGKSVTTNEEDAVVQLEKAIAILQNKDASVEERSAALRTAAEITVDIHCPANILIDKHLDKNFTFLRHNSMQKEFRFYVQKEMSWQNLWHNEFHRSHGAFSADMYLFDWHIATKGMAKNYKSESVAPRKWVEQMGDRVMHLIKVFSPDVLLEMVEVQRVEEVNNACMYDAAFRLANLLNKTLK